MSSARCSTRKGRSRSNVRDVWGNANGRPSPCSAWPCARRQRAWRRCSKGILSAELHTNALSSATKKSAGRACRVLLAERSLDQDGAVLAPEEILTVDHPGRRTEDARLDRPLRPHDERLLDLRRL